MSIFDWIQTLSFIGAVILATLSIGPFWARLVEGKPTILYPYLGWLERISYRLGKIDPQEEMGWVNYTKCLLLFNFWGFLTLFLLLVTQAYLPFNPQHFDNVPGLLALNTAISFVTNTNWQAYAGETTLSYGSQMLGLTVQNFTSAATGSALLMAFIRGITRKTSNSIGNFWADMIRSIVYLLLPLAIVLAIVLVSQGVVQTLEPYAVVETIEKTTQTIPLGPAASQVAIKQLGTNGGGFFNTNSTHPFENPTPLSNFLQMVSLFAIPSAMVYAYGLLINSKKHAYLLLGVMCVIWAVGFSIAQYSENLVNPVMDAYPVMEGKEVRLGNTNSLLWATATTASSNGSVNAMHESLSPLAGGVALLNIMLGELIIGGVGVGLCSMLMFVLLTVFLCGLMVGRTPEYLGKKIEKKDVQWIILAVLAPSTLILIGAGVTSLVPNAMSSLLSKGPHGLTELLYAFASAAGNNGSAFAGINANTDYYNLTLSVFMLLGRLSIVIPSLALAGNLAAKKVAPESAGTLDTKNLFFAFLLLGIILIVCALTFFPALALGPIVEHFLMLQGRAFPIHS